MTSAHWTHVKEVFHAVLELEPSQRSTYLDTVCAEEPSLRQEVESLLSSHGEAGTDFLKASALESADWPAEQAAKRGAGGLEEESGHGVLRRLEGSNGSRVSNPIALIQEAASPILERASPNAPVKLLVL